MSAPTPHDATGMAPWRATVLTLFPEMFPGPPGYSLAGQALDSGVWSLATYNIRDFGIGRHRTVDDNPAGCGPGTVMRCGVAAAAIGAARKLRRDPRLLYTRPRERPDT